MPVIDSKSGVAAMFAQMAELHERTFGPIRDAMATLAEHDELPTIDDVAAMLHPAAPAIQINIFINREDEQ